MTGLLSGRRTIAIILAMALITPFARAAERKFLSGYAGMLPSSESDKARTYFRMPAVKALLERLESGPQSRETVEQSLAGSGVTIAQLERMSILRRSGDGYGIGFAYFTAQDMRRIAAVTDALVPSLAASYAAHKKDFDRIFARYSVPTVRRADLAFVILSGMSLNWDGLALTEELHDRQPVLVSGPGYQYSFWASEELPERSHRSFFWGSSTYPEGEWSFSSFGDPYSDPRMNFPDLAFIEVKEMSAPLQPLALAAGAGPADAFGQHFDRVLGDKKLAEIARMLFLLRDGPRTAAELTKDSGTNTQPILRFLEAIQYVERTRRGSYALTVPVFDERDRPMLRDALALSRSILSEWLRQHGPEIRAQLAGLTAMKSGVTFEQLFTQIWHELFGATTRELARAGVTADPYGPAVRSKGSLSMLWKRSLYKFTPG